MSKLPKPEILIFIKLNYGGTLKWTKMKFQDGIF